MHVYMDAWKKNIYVTTFKLKKVTVFKHIKIR